jgi:hypothetical protein
MLSPRALQFAGYCNPALRAKQGGGPSHQLIGLHREASERGEDAAELNCLLFALGETRRLEGEEVRSLLAEAEGLLAKCPTASDHEFARYSLFWGACRAGLVDEATQHLATIEAEHPTWETPWPEYEWLSARGALARARGDHVEALELAARTAEAARLHGDLLCATANDESVKELENKGYEGRFSRTPPPQAPAKKTLPRRRRER